PVRQQKPEVSMTPSRSIRWVASRIASAALCGVLLAGVLAGAAQSASAGARRTENPSVAAPAVPMLDWRPCDNGFLCATATVPLDYARPFGATIELAVIKHPATDPAH